MNTQTVYKIIVTFLLFLVLQLLVFRHFVIQDYAFCFMYIACILLLPNEIPPTWVIFISFLVGLTTDIFYDTAGVHASACTLIGYLRAYIIKFLFPNKGLESEVVISIAGMGTERFVRYLVIMVLIHHTFLFFIEAGTLQYFVVTLIKIISSVFVTTLTIVLLHVTFRGIQHK